MTKTPREEMRALMEAVAPQPATKVNSKVAMSKFMQTLPDYYHELGGSSSASKHLYRGRGNSDLSKVEAYLKSNGYRQRFKQVREQEWYKVTGMPYGETSQMRSYHTVRIYHNGDSIVNVSHSNHMQ